MSEEIKCDSSCKAYCNGRCALMPDGVVLTGEGYDYLIKPDGDVTKVEFKHDTIIHPKADPNNCPKLKYEALKKL